MERGVCSTSDDCEELEVSLGREESCDHSSCRSCSGRKAKRSQISCLTCSRVLGMAVAMTGGVVLEKRGRGSRLHRPQQRSASVNTGSRVVWSKDGGNGTRMGSVQKGKACRKVRKGSGWAATGFYTHHDVAGGRCAGSSQATSDHHAGRHPGQRATSKPNAATCRRSCRGLRAWHWWPHASDSLLRPLATCTEQPSALSRLGSGCSPLHPASSAMMVASRPGRRCSLDPPVTSPCEAERRQPATRMRKQRPAEPPNHQSAPAEHEHAPRLTWATSPALRRPRECGSATVSISETHESAMAFARHRNVKVYRIIVIVIVYFDLLSISGSLSFISPISSPSSRFSGMP
jgi:hypothetical protein